MCLPNTSTVGEVAQNEAKTKDSEEKSYSEDPNLTKAEEKGSKNLKKNHPTSAIALINLE